MDDLDQPLHMWGYWSEKYGLEAALRDYYPNLARSNSKISHHLMLMSSARDVIDAEMLRLAGDAEDEE